MGDYLNRSDVVDALFRRGGGPSEHGPSHRDIEKLVTNLEDLIAETLANDGRVLLLGFGAFKTRERKARTVPNPRDPSQRIQVPAKRAPVFTPGTKLKEMVAAKVGTSQPRKHGRT